MPAWHPVNAGPWATVPWVLLVWTGTSIFFCPIATEVALRSPIPSKSQIREMHNMRHHQIRKCEIIHPKCSREIAAAFADPPVPKLQLSWLWSRRPKSQLPNSCNLHASTIIYMHPHAANRDGSSCLERAWCSQE